MAQQVRSSTYEGFEDPNAGVIDQEPQEAGPGVMGKILTTFSIVKQRVSGHGSTPTTPRGAETQLQQGTPSPLGVETHQQHESNVEDLKHSPRNVETVSDHESKVGRDFKGAPEEHPAPGQVPHDAVGLDTAGAGGRVGDGVEAFPAGARSTGGSSRYVEAAGISPRGSGRSLREEGTPASPRLPKKDLAERIMDKLPGTHLNPYSVGVPTRATNPYMEGDQSPVATSPSFQRSSNPSSPSIFGKLKNMVTGQKASQGTATENATTGTAGTTGDLSEQTEEKLGGNKGPDAGSVEEWPARTTPDISAIPSATRTNAEGQPIEGPTQPVSEDTKKEGLMTKLMDKLHIHEKSSSPRATARDLGTGSPAATTGTPIATADTRASQETGIPTPTIGGPETTIGTATGPTEN